MSLFLTTTERECLDKQFKILYNFLTLLVPWNEEDRIVNYDSVQEMFTINMQMTENMSFLKKFTYITLLYPKCLFVYKTGNMMSRQSILAVT